jgi:hypothetical protein
VSTEAEEGQARTEPIRSGDPRRRPRRCTRDRGAHLGPHTWHRTPDPDGQPGELGVRQARLPPPLTRATTRDRRLITIRRGGTLADADHVLLALWAASCAEHVLHHVEAERPADARARLAVGSVRAWTTGDIGMMECRAAGGHAIDLVLDDQRRRNDICWSVFEPFGTT